ncbi:restriction endonuclease subunit S [Antrihabitans spumae]|uniref:Restriction endonuclease subunit S n=1 Tax=Antrihabitans spumae TaxID=3373370 RepID=A0ABW7KAJ5_9NOCA
MNVPAYKEYRESGVEWVGKVPSHWIMRQIKWGNPVRRGASPRPIDDPKYFDDDGYWSWVRIADVSASRAHLTKTTQRLSELGSSLSVKLNPGSLFVSIAGTVGKPCINDIPVCIHDGFVYFPDLDIDSEFLFRIFEAGECYKGLGKFGTQLNLNTDTIGSIPIPIPTCSEQRLITDFLDRETAKVDLLISKQEQLIATLREDRAATITRAVTKGLEPDDDQMKDSGVPWLGSIPATWTRQKLNWCFTFLNGDRGTNYPASNELTDEGIPFVNAGHLRDGRIDFSSMNYVSKEKYASMGGAKLRPGDILYCLRGSLGKNAIFTAASGGALASSLVALRSRNPLAVDCTFAFWMLNSAAEDAQLAMIGSGSAQPNLSVDDLGGFVFGIPPIDEQLKIAAFLETRCGNIDKLISKAAEVIRTIREYRLALITAAVTGKIDVREAI